MAKKRQRGNGDDKDTAMSAIVLVGVVKDRRDLRIAQTKRWYRIPVAHAPVRRFHYLAFYQPASFGREGKRITHYARVLGVQEVKRRVLLPDEPDHPRADHLYMKVRLGKIEKLSSPIRNIIPRRVSFGFTTLYRLRTAKHMLQLYDIVPTEQIIADALEQVGIPAHAQYYIKGKRRYRLDFAILCKRGSIAIECDNKKAHSGKRQKEKDRAKDAFLVRNGWTVIRLLEDEVVADSGKCIAKIQKTAKKLGGHMSAPA